MRLAFALITIFFFASPSFSTDYPVVNGFYHMGPPLLQVCDPHGIAVVNYDVNNIGIQHDADKIAEYALSTVTLDNMDIITKANLDWLLHKGPNYLYLYNNPNIPNCISPWVSSLAQGRAASALCWGYRKFHNHDYLRAALQSILQLSLDDQARHPIYKRVAKGSVWYRHFSGGTIEVSEGSIAAVAGALDLYNTLPNNNQARNLVKSILDEGIAGLKVGLSKFNLLVPSGGLYMDSNQTPISLSSYKSSITLLGLLASYDPSLAPLLQQATFPPGSEPSE